ncbi:MAG: sulfatase, partial [Candidatus Hydrogenedentes bacterium]|nr:sulfatase [Candidatus Hydrogenedentota bacterium]
MIAGCGDVLGNTPLAAVEPPLGLASPREGDAPEFPVQRLVRQLLEQQRARTAPPEAIPLKAAGVMGAEAVQVMDGGIQVSAQEGKPWVQFPVSLDARRCNTLRVTIQADAGNSWGVDWISDRKPEFLAGPLLTAPLFAEAQPHSYTLTLDPFGEERWAGAIRALRLWPLDIPGRALITEVQLLYTPPRGPRRVFIENQTLEAVAGTQAPWRVRVPEGGVFEAALGMKPAEHSDGARFVVTLETAEATAVVLAEEHILPYAGAGEDWRRIRADLAPYAGKDVTLHLTVESGASSTGDLPFWGDPIVYSMAQGPRPTPVILISLDTLRADHLSSYGYPRETTPFLDAFAKEAVLFEQCVTPESWTLNAHVSIMTGVHPRTHGVTANSNLSETFPTLGQTLSDAGYLAGAFTGHGTWVAPWRGVGYGFDVFNLPPLIDGRYRYRNIFDTKKTALEWVKNHAAAPILLFLHSYDVHSKPAEPAYKLPYEIREAADFFHFSAEVRAPALTRPGLPEFHGRTFIDAHNNGQLQATPEETEYLQRLYADGIRVLDREVHGFLDELKTLNLYEDALIIVTSDHGEGFNEHGTFDHINMYEENARVPLLIKFPQAQHSGARIKTLVELQDIFPTVLDTLGLPIPASVEGRSLLALLRGKPRGQEQAFGQREQYRTLRQPPWKLVDNVRAGQFQLFNLEEDPLERDDVWSNEKATGERLQGILEEFYAPRVEGGWTITLSGGEAPLTVELTGVVDGGFLFAT